MCLFLRPQFTFPNLVTFLIKAACTSIMLQPKFLVPSLIPHSQGRWLSDRFLRSVFVCLHVSEIRVYFSSVHQNFQPKWDFQLHKFIFYFYKIVAGFFYCVSRSVVEGACPMVIWAYTQGGSIALTLRLGMV